MMRERATHRRTRRTDTRRLVVFGLAVGVLVLAGLGFIYKMTEFAHTILEKEVAGFGAVSIGFYLTGVIPIMFLTLWAVLTGRFSDIERPKYRMLELDDEIERGGALDDLTTGATGGAAHDA